MNLELISKWCPIIIYFLWGIVAGLFLRPQIDRLNNWIARRNYQKLVDRAFSYWQKDSPRDWMYNPAKSTRIWLVIEGWLGEGKQLDPNEVGDFLDAESQYDPLRNEEKEFIVNLVKHVGLGENF